MRECVCVSASVHACVAGVCMHACVCVCWGGGGGIRGIKGHSYVHVAN